MAIRPRLSHRRSCEVAFWHFSDMPRERGDFRYERNSGHAPARLESPSLTLDGLRIIYIIAQFTIEQGKQHGP
jgi:hypothetical protein